MGQSIVEARQMSLAEYDDLMRGWEKAHESADSIEPPSPDWWEAQQARIENSPHLTGRTIS